jgi:hypothetical protein
MSNTLCDKTLLVRVFSQEHHGHLTGVQLFTGLLAGLGHRSVGLFYPRTNIMRTRQRGINPYTGPFIPQIAELRAKRNGSPPLEAYNQYSTYVDDQLLPEDGTELVSTDSRVSGLEHISSGSYETITDSIDGVRAKLKLRPCSHERIQYSVNPGMYHTTNESFGPYGAISETTSRFTPGYGDVVAVLALRQQPTTNDKNFVRARFTAGEYDATNLGEFFAELGQLKILYQSSALSLANILIPGKNFRVSKDGKLIARSATFTDKALSLINADLLYQWGLSPLVNDVGALLQAVEKFNRFALNRASATHPIRVSSHLSQQYTAEPYTLSNIEFGSSRVRGYKTTTLTGSWTYRVTGYYTYPEQIVSSVFNGLYEMFLGHGGSRPIGTLFNTLPFSFILDWFLPLGDWLDGLRVSSSNAPTLLGACDSVTVECLGSRELGVTLFPTNHSPGVSHTVAGSGYASVSVKVKSYDRALVESPTAPVGLPTFRIPNVGQLTSLAELLTVIASSKFRKKFR